MNSYIIQIILYKFSHNYINLGSKLSERIAQIIYNTKCTYNFKVAIATFMNTNFWLCYFLRGSQKKNPLWVVEMKT